MNSFEGNYSLRVHLFIAASIFDRKTSADASKSKIMGKLSKTFMKVFSSVLIHTAEKHYSDKRIINKLKKNSFEVKAK